MKRTAWKRALAAMAAASLCLAAAFGLAACGSSGEGEGEGGDAADSAASEQAVEGSSSSWQDAAGEGDAEAEADDAPELQIYAAEEFQTVLPALQELYCEANPDVSFADTRFDSSDDLADRIVSAADADLLLTASAESMDAAEDSIDPASRIDLFTTDLVVIMAEDSGASVDSVEDVFELEGVIGICDPARAVDGVYALQALQDAGFVEYELDATGEVDGFTWFDPIADKADASSEDAEELAVRIASGELEAGFVCACDLPRLEGVEAVYTTESDSHETIACSGAVLADSANPDLAADFLDFCLTDEDAQQLLEAYGFDLLG